MERQRRRGWRISVLLTVLVGLLALPATASGQVRVEDPGDACPEPVNPPAPFTDRGTISSAHVLNVDCAFNYRITRGFPDNTFRPGVTITRDQFASFLVATIEVADRRELPAPSDQGFTDVPSNNPHRDAINQLTEVGIIAGRTPTTFAPSLDLTRDQIASLLLNAVAFLEDVPAENLFRDDAQFEDVPASNVHYTRINGARVLEIATGTSVDPDLYSPRRGVSRQQMASFLIRLLAALSDGGSIIPPELRVTTLDLDPATAVRDIGGTHTLTATATDTTGAPVEGAQVRFEIYRDDDTTDGARFEGPVGTATQGRTDVDGEVELTYTGPAVAAEDVVVACILDLQRDDCQVQTSGTPAGFTGQPTVGARVDDTASVTWTPTRTVFPSERADAVATGPRAGGTLEILFAPVIEALLDSRATASATQTPGPQVDSDQDVATLALPDNPVLGAATAAVRADANTDTGTARAVSQTGDVEVLGLLPGGDPVLGADLLRSVAVAQCLGPDAGDPASDEALERASDGTTFGGLTIAGTAFDGPVPVNQELDAGGLATITLRSVEHLDGPGDEFGYRTVAAEVRLLGGITGGGPLDPILGPIGDLLDQIVEGADTLLTLRFGEAEATVAGCSDEPVEVPVEAPGEGGEGDGGPFDGLPGLPGLPFP